MKVRITSAQAKNNREGKEIVNRYGKRLVEVTVEGHEGSFESWSERFLREVGQEVDAELGERNHEYNGKTYVTKTINHPRQPFGSGNGHEKDPDTVLIAYAKDAAIALVQAGKVTDAEELSKKIRSFSQLFFGIYDKRKSGKPVVELNGNGHDSLDGDKDFEQIAQDIPRPRTGRP